MKGSTHLAVGAVSGMFLGDITAVATAAAGAILPDIDTPSSMAGHWFGGRITRLAVGGLLIYYSLKTGNQKGMLLGAVFLGLAFMPHRGLTHSLAGLALFSMAAYILPIPFIPFVIGYVSHLLLDMLTPMGIPVFWPLSLNVKIPIAATGGLVDWAIGLSATGYFLLNMSKLIV